MWELEIKHEGLHKYKVIRNYDKHIVEQKARILRESWEEKWQKQQNREKVAYGKDSKKRIAIEQTKEAEARIELMQNILVSSLNDKIYLKWEKVIDENDYPVEKPQTPRPKIIPLEPNRFIVEFQFPMNIIVSLPFFKNSILLKKQREADCLSDKASALWCQKRENTLELNKKALLDYQSKLKKWEGNRRAYIKIRDERNEGILDIKRRYLAKDFNTVEDHCKLVLSLLDYPDTFPEKFDVIYNVGTKMLLVDYFLPSKDDLPKLKEVKYNISRDEFINKYLTDSEFNDIYDGVIYQVVLKIIHDLYKSDEINAIDSIALNGNVSFVDSATGQKVTSCIVSIVTMKKDFININLAAVNPKDCFKSLKGVGSSKLHGLVPITPIIIFDKNDKRFVAPREVIGGIDSGTNLAAMDWQDFENLIRDVFEKEFSSSGGEVKITRASRDEGVDAVVFDPDPIKGGKIVIQAKRYTNTVGVSAVRDLYGTIMNEGAMKGILITTADYGPDAYNFAKDKPITLLNGGHLLHMLAKHGYKAKIDLAEAKKILNEE